MKIELMIYVSTLKIYIKLGKFEQFNIFAVCNDYCKKIYNNIEIFCQV